MGTLAVEGQEMKVGVVDTPLSSDKMTNTLIGTLHVVFVSLGLCYVT